ncbi:MAG: hypothetical protein E7080_02510 [Bacteroidales bacterium]|nr:hypothetical protein [Bacteroidales bacterium]
MKPIVSYIVIISVMLAVSIDVKADNGYPSRCEVLRGYDECDVRSRCDSVDLQPIEGMWYYAEEGMTVVIERCEEAKLYEAQDYRIVYVDGEDMMLLPGTVIGYCKPTADACKYKVWIYGEQKMSVLENLQVCLGELSDDASRLIIKRSEVNMRVRVNFTHFLPKLLKGISVSSSGVDEVNFPEGFRKIYPKVKRKQGKVRYL